MSNVLLVTLPQREPRAALQEAVEWARSLGGKLFVVAALDPEIGERVSSSLSDIGFMGEKVSDSVRDTLLREYEQRAKQLVEDLAAEARRSGVEAEGLVKRGDPSEVCCAFVRRHGIRGAILVSERRSWITRLLSRGAVQVPMLEGCEVRVREEE